MIGEHVVKWEGGQHVLKLSTRAMAGIEDATGLPFAEAMKSIGDEEGFRVKRLSQVLAPTMNGGKGATLDEAFELIDEIGLEAAGEAIGAAAEKAFPDLKGDAAGNGKTRKAAKI